MKTKKRLAVVFGGRSGEHEVSIVSARSLVKAIDNNHYEIIPMAIDQQGLWADGETAKRVLDDSLDNTGGVVSFTGVSKLDQRLLDGSIDVVFPILHGPFGEDGTIQGLLEVLDLPYVGCDVTSSAICMDKIICKRLFVEGGFNTAAWCEISRERWVAQQAVLEEACFKIGLPLFVKPSCLGSSVGISKVSSREELIPAIEIALDHDDRVIVEQTIVGREIEVAVLGNSDPKAALPGEIIPGGDFYDYDDKYVSDACQLLAPAHLGDDQRERVQALAIDVYRRFGCAGMARVDLFLEDEKIWVNEINTIPGFTSISMYPRLWLISGLSYATLINNLVDLAIDRFANRSTGRKARRNFD